MRKDISKVIVERPRRGGNADRKGRYKENLRSQIENAALFGDDSEGPVISSPIRDRSYDRKSLNENLKPLLRFLASKVGCVWNDVYSEMRQNLDFNSAVQKHVMDHVKQYVVKDTVLMEDGSVIAYIPYWQSKYDHYVLSDTTKGLAPSTFYVHPTTKVLLQAGKRYSRYRRTKRRPAHDTYQISELEQYRRLENGWFFVQLTKINKDDLWKHEADSVFKRNSPFDTPKTNKVHFAFEYGDGFLRAISKRQCGHKEIAKIYELIQKNPANFFPSS